MSNDNDRNSDQSKSFQEHAERCRRLSLATHDRSVADMLNRMADSYERGQQPENES